ncbi:MAG: hypothetical protein ACXQTV_03230 [Candidatus Hecatellaceae archaeon]
MVLSLQDSTLSGWLAELSFKTLEKAEGCVLEVPQGLEFLEEQAEEPDFCQLENFKPQVFPVKVSKQRTRVVAVDVACKRVGLTSGGLLCAVRGTIVWRDEYAYRYSRYGPFVFYLNHGWPSQVLNGLFPGSFEVSASPLSMAAKVQMLVERELQLQACRTFKDSLILFDGSLSVATESGGWASDRLREALQRARDNGSRVMAVTKSTKLLSQGEPLFDFCSRVKPPCLIQVKPAAYGFKGNFKSLGRIFLAKLAYDSPGFRLDIDAGLSLEEALEATGSLLSSDLLVQGYPETLRLAHMLSVLTPLDMLGVQRFLAENFGVKVRRVRSVRRLLFGPYAGEEVQP